MNFLRGYLLFRTEKNHYIVFSRNVDLNTGREINYYFELADDANGKPVVTSVKGLNEEAPPEFRQGLVDFLNFTYLYLSNKNTIAFSTVVEDPWDDYTLFFSFNRLLPFFRFLAIGLQGLDARAYAINSSGMLKTDQLKDFFQVKLKSVEYGERKDIITVIPSKNTLAVEINGMGTILDENWVYDDSIGSPGYWLVLNSYRDSQITVEKIPGLLLESGGLTIEEICRLSIIISEGIDYSSIYASYNNEVLQVAYALADSNKIKNYQYLIVKKVNDDSYTINFSTFADIFDANIDYYKNIIDNLKKSQSNY